MKKTFNYILTCCIMTLVLTFSLASCGKNCEHAYDDCADIECNLCGETRDSMHSWKEADCVTPKICTVCQKADGEALGHEWTTPDVDQCEVQSTCSRCGATEGQNKEHSYDNACDVACNECNKIRVAGHDYSLLQNDETYHWYVCAVCERVDGENKSRHGYDNDCDTTCNICAKARATEHTPNEDDGDCTTPVTCTECPTVITVAKSHDFGGAWEKDASGHWHVCKNDGCSVTDTKADHISDGAATEEKAEKCTVCEYVIVPELEHTHKHNIPKYDTENHWLECACGDKSAIISHSATDDNDCTTAVTCSGCAHIMTAAKAHTPNADDGDCTTDITCKDCGKITTAGYTEHTPNIDDGDCTTPIDCKVCGTIITPATDGHTAEPDDHDCTTPTRCVTCEKVFVEAKEHTGGTATCGSKAACESCGTAYGELDLDNHVVIDGSCACGEIWHIDATEMTAEQLNAAVAEKLAAGETDIEIILAPDAPAKMLTAIRHAICDTEGVEDGSIKLTLRGVNVIPSISKEFPIFGPEEKGREYIYVTQLGAIILPDAHTIGDYAFAESGVTYVDAPNVTSVGEKAFAFGNVKFTYINLPKCTNWTGEAFSGFKEKPNFVDGATVYLTAEGDFEFNYKAGLPEHAFIGQRDATIYINLVLNSDKQNGTANMTIVQNDDGTATLSYMDTLNRWNSYTFKSITFACTDGTTNHSISYSDNGNGSHNYACTQCSYVEISGEAHTGGAQSCTAWAKCRNCNAYYAEPLGHDYVYSSNELTITATCNRSGCGISESVTLYPSQADGYLPMVGGSINGKTPELQFYYEGERVNQPSHRDNKEYTAAITVGNITVSTTFLYKTVTLPMIIADEKSNDLRNDGT